MEVARTAGPGDGERLGRAAVADGADVLIAHGGDGTAMEVAAALVGTGRALGLLPAGTGNLLAGNLRVRRSWRAAADVMLAAAPRAIDVGRLTTAAGSRYFAVACGTGFDAELMRSTAPRYKRIFGMGAYVAKAVGLATDIRRVRLRIEADGALLETHGVFVLVANCGKLIPGILHLHAAIRPDDGVFEVIVFDATSMAGAARVFWRMLQRQPHADPGITFLRASRVAITAEPALPAQADGEACGMTPLEVELLPRALHVLAPPGA